MCTGEQLSSKPFPYSQLEVCIGRWRGRAPFVRDPLRDTMRAEMITQLTFNFSVAMPADWRMAKGGGTKGGI